MIDIKNGFITNDDGKLLKLWYEEGCRQGLNVRGFDLNWFSGGRCFYNGHYMTAGWNGYTGKAELTLADFESKSVRHPCAHQIITLVNNWGTHAVMIKEPENPKWIRGNQVDAIFPCFHVENQYQVIPKQHVKCFLAFHNENKDIEFVSNKENNTWRSANCPSWCLGRTYRVKSDEPKLIKNTTYTLAELLLLEGGVFDNFGSKLENEYEIADAYFTGKTYFKEDKPKLSEVYFIYKVNLKEEVL